MNSNSKQVRRSAVITTATTTLVTRAANAQASPATWFWHALGEITVPQAAWVLGTIVIALLGVARFRNAR
ncbi:MAG: hypothetical protein ACPG1A_09090 [Halioglobus sp.]